MSIAVSDPATRVESGGYASIGTHFSGAFTTALLLAAFLTACACPHTAELRTIWEERAELVRARPLRAQSEDESHLVMSVRFEALNRLLADAIARDMVPAQRTEVSIPTGLLGQSVRAGVAVRPTALALHADATCEGCVALEATLRCELRLSALPGLGKSMRFDLRTAGTAPLTLGQDEDGEPTLQLETSELTLGAIDLVAAAGYSLPPEIERNLRTAARRLAQTGLGRVNLTTFPPLELAAGTLKAAPVSVATDASRDTLAVGWMTNLDVPSSPAMAAWRDRPLTDDVRLALAPELVPAILSAMMANDTLPRRFDGDGDADPDGAYGVTVDGVELADDTITAAFRLWRVSCPCFVAELRTSASIVRNHKGFFEAHLTEVVLVDTDRFETWINAALWRQSELATRLAEVSQQLLNERLFSVGSHHVRIEAKRYVLDEHAIVISGDASIQQIVID